MAIYDAVVEPQNVIMPNDGVVWKSVHDEKYGGVTVKMGTATGYTYPFSVIPSGSIVLQNTTTKEFVLLDVDNTDPVNPTYIALPAGYAYVGLTRASKLATEPLVSIVDGGKCNYMALTIPIAAAMRTAIKTAIPTLIFQED